MLLIDYHHVPRRLLIIFTVDRAFLDTYRAFQSPPASRRLDTPCCFMIALGDDGSLLSLSRALPQASYPRRLSFGPLITGPSRRIVCETLPSYRSTQTVKRFVVDFEKTRDLAAIFVANPAADIWHGVCPQ